MGKLDQPGYPLPSGELGEDEIVCQLVFFPNRDEYWQALLGALSYMATWRAWERDDDKRGKDAASNWREAFELTIGCWRMACLEQLQQDVSDILFELKNNSCCEGGDITDGKEFTDEVEDGVGDVPQNIIDAGYASDTSDWAGFEDYKCMISHVAVDQLALRLRKLQPHVESAGVIIGGLATIAVILSSLLTGGLTIITLGILASTGAVAAFYAYLVTEIDLEDLADKVDDYHDEMVCYMNDSDGSDDALLRLNHRIGLIFSIPEMLLLRNMNLGPTIRALYSGRYDEQNVAQQLADEGYDVLDFTCPCDQADLFELRIDGSGTFSSLDRLQSELDDGCDKCTLVRLYRKFDDRHVGMKVISVGGLTPGTCDGKSLYILWEHVTGGPIIYDSDTPPSNVNNVGSIHVQRSFSFTNCLVLWELPEPT